MDILARLFTGWSIFVAIFGGIILFLFIEISLGVLGASILKEFGIDDDNSKPSHFILGNSIAILFILLLWFLGGLLN